MKIQELRIGNIIDTVGKTGAVRVTGILDDMVFTENGNYLSRQCVPVELSVEWLKRAGFKPTGTGFHIGEFEVEEAIEGCWLSGNDCILTLHLHQLQNIYHALTGKELEVLL